MPGLFGISGLLIRQYRTQRSTANFSNKYELEFKELGIKTMFNMPTGDDAVKHAKKLVKDKVTSVAVNLQNV